MLFAYLYFGLNLDTNLERIMVMLVIASFAFTSVSLLIIREVPLTRKEAIEISKGSSRVKKGLAFNSGVEASYYNSSMVEQLKLGHNREIYEKVPKGHSIWKITWYIGTGIGGYTIGVIVDAEVGVIITEIEGIVFF